jgi:non-specific serine/threonine protein kinase
VALFALRARAKANASAVVELCRRLDGLPLGIELAAAWVHPLGGARAVLARLEACLDEQGSASQDQPARHRTPRAAISWSYDLLTPEEQAVFEQLSVFAGGWTLDAASAVCERSPVDMLGVLRALVDKHLVQSLEQPDGESRFQMLVTLRSFANSRLAARGAADRAERCQAEFFARLAEEADQGLNGPGQREWLDRLEVEYDNIRTALNWSVAHNAVQIALGMAGSLWFFWDMRGHLREGREWLALLLSHAGGQEPGTARVMALNAAGWTALVQGDYATSVRAHEEAVALSKALQDPGLSCRSRMHLAVALGIGPQELDRADVLYAEREQTARELAEQLPWVIRLILYGRGHVAALRGETAEADRLWGECVLSELSGNLYALSYIQFRWGVLAIQSGQLDHARGCLAEAVRYACEIDCTRETGVAMDALAWVAAAQGDSDRAARLLGAAETLLDRAGYNVPPFMAAGHARAETTSRERLGEREWTLAKAEAKRLSREDALRLARDDLDTGRHPGRPGRRPNRRGGNRLPLTERELQVAALVAEGLTNRQIARRLGIGERTVVSHLEHAFMKLGVQTRAQVAVRVSSQLRDSSVSNDESGLTMVTTNSD